MKRNKLVTFTAIAALIVAGSSVGCSSVKSMTCEQLGELSYSEGTDKIIDLIRKHDLDPYSNALGAASVIGDVYLFCGISVLTGGPATKNLDKSIDSAVDWSFYGD